MAATTMHAINAAACAPAATCSAQKGAKASALKTAFAGRALRQVKVNAAAPKAAFTVVAAADARPLWFPGSSAPEWLDGSLPGDYGFDPLGLASEPDLLKWFVQAELQNGRWAMLGAAGIFIPEFLTKAGILNTPHWFEAGAYPYFTDAPTLFAIQLALFGWAEGRRWADIIKPGSVNTDPIFSNNKLTGTDVGYPGGLWFDPLGFGSGGGARKMRAKEIANGRLAMLAVLGAFVQYRFTGVGPADNLFDHLSDPGYINVVSTFHL